MRVTSSLADIDFEVGELRVEAGELVVESGAASTIATTVRLDPAEGRRILGLLIFSGATWRFLASMLFAGRKASGASASSAWEERRQRTGLNKPW
ncbi:hypothetical protein [Rhizorhabdus wittichii]|jgi:hypothetical protein|uniref:Uncharacterized protein n=1 Tax=Rhizorhabdus wittichii (strain DSM 6014 / CCUG 31198 / JCM 15750 / NBRC 105917 / EY 4224 / RW1) TaxID=392499 RepID=A0A9J9LC60_RHIWR|nr:hypothetical protein [Rhizorhabdus wittichii]ABQ68057.1 hypothetical protein Swit_1694 [Rhizorhabdus wittichii RW1]ARR55038.1 hypothetical protein HY78_17115 [Rhizorhabdus wittichii DC-6]